MKIVLLIPPSKYAKNVARDLVYGCWCKGKRIAGVQFPPLSLILVGTVLKQNGFDVTLLDAAAEGLSVEDIKKTIVTYDFLILLTSTMTLNEDALLLGVLKNTNLKLKTIVFGGHVTAEPESTLSRKSIDIVVRREAEYIINDLLRAFKAGGDGWKKIRGISFINNGTYQKNEDYPLIDHLDKLPIPARSMLSRDIHYYNPVVKRLPYTTMFTTRGCPGACTFCSSPLFYGRRIRAMSGKRVLEEIREVVRLGYKEIFFRDEIFTAFPNRVKEICEGIINEKMDISWICSSRIDTINKEMMEIMKRAGCHMIRLGVESGVQELLDNVKKGTKVEKTEQVFKWSEEVGIDTHAHMMIGMPGETAETIEKTIKFILKINPTIVTFGILTPYPGTELFSILREHHPEFKDGTSMDLRRIHTHSFYNEYFTSLTSDDLQKYIRKVYRKFYLRPAYIWRWIKKVRSADEFKRIALAATNVFAFIFGKD